MNDLKLSGGGMPKNRSELKVEEKWNVEALYENPDAWSQEFVHLKGGDGKSKWPEIETYKGKLSDPNTAASFFELYFGLDRKLMKLHTYAHLRLDEDLGDDRFKRDYGLISSLIHDFQEECSWVEPELLSLQEKDFQTLQLSPSLNPYQFYLQKIGKMRPHTLTAEMEALMALSGKALDTSYKAFSALNNADLQFEPAVDSEGKKHPLTNGSYLSFLRNSDRELRKSAFQNLHKGFEVHANTIAELLNGQVQSHLYHAKARKFGSCLSAALFPNQIDPVVYENLIASVTNAQPLMHEYIALRKKLLGVEELHYYDLMVPLVEKVEIEMNYQEAADAVIASVALLGKEYQEDVKKGLVQERWVDVYETPRKRSGAYSSGCYDSMPYILMNYQGTLNDVLTLAHEMGHSMHSLLSRKNQSYIYAQYPIFVAEVASTFNEQLLLKMLKTKVKSKKEKAYLINYEIEGIRGTIFRQTMFAEFELQLHRWAEEGVPLTPALLKEYYVELNRKYYGPDLVIDKELAIEWARIPHFYYNFYVYQYATGLSAAISLFQQAQGSKEAVDRYLKFLSSGGSRYPIDLLATAGVDMRTTQAVDGAMQKFRQLLNELKECLDE
ncbi:MAG: oligoendopeptidase F [Verrucomicrobia bacterium RIFCSPHIGHO2_12_FULL_41_10]|nr:MAG: oligoendopeptidase F [Verrucomicrobia bacterium RIFCSPHIGHO2_12_FULL_41_10]